MSLMHEFFICDFSSTATYEELMEFYRDNRPAPVEIRDTIVRRTWNHLGGFKCYWKCRDEIHKGLDYYGFSLIPIEFLNDFLDLLNPFPYCILYWSLRRLCMTAIKTNRSILHMGI